MANVYSESRPLHGNGPQTQQHKDLSEFAHNQSTQDLLQRMCADLFQERPADSVGYLISWLEAERKRRQEKEQAAVDEAAS